MDFADIDPESIKKSLNITQRPKKYRKSSMYIYISVGLALASSGRDLDATGRGTGTPLPQQKRMLGPTHTYIHT